MDEGRGSRQSSLGEGRLLSEKGGEHRKIILNCRLYGPVVVILGIPSQHARLTQRETSMFSIIFRQTAFNILKNRRCNIQN